MTRRAKKTAAPEPEAPAAASAPFDPREPKAENIIDQLGATGWDFFKDGGPHADALRPPENPKQQRLALVAMVLWSIPEFRELIEHLLDVSVRRSKFHPSLGLPINEAYGYGMFREGQDSVVHLVLKMIAEGRKQIAPPPREA